MDLTEYERAKFELAAILRAAVALLREGQPDVQAPFSDLFARLAEDRFNLVVVGRFSRGKTSLMNAMLDTENLPTGIVPLTSVITTVSYGSSARAFIEHEGWAIAEEITLDALPDYVTQQGNPGNRRRVAVARVELPVELLRRGFHFVDTPGLGSSILENTRTTERFLPEADAFMLVTSYDSPLSEEELRIVRRVAPSPSRIFLVINKHDTVSAGERQQVLSHVRDQTRAVFGDLLPRVFSVSALEALKANKHNDRERLLASGVPELREELAHFLLNEKQAEFLMRMCERVADALRTVPDATQEAERLRSLHQEIAQHRPNTTPLMSTPGMAATDKASRFSACRICARLDREIYDFLCRYQYDVYVSREMQIGLAERGGLCSFHTWQYGALATPYGTCAGFSVLLERLAYRLREIAATSPADGYSAEIEKLRPTAETCDVCRIRREVEQAAVADMARSLAEAGRQAKDRFSGLCLTHLQLVVEAIGSGETKGKLLLGEADMLKRLSEDMRRYALKHEGMRRDLANVEEVSADRRALTLLAGHRNVNGLSKPQ
jgi:GTP-binding protein EngB required for normal cell division